MTNNPVTNKITMTYRNYRGEVSERTITPLSIRWGVTEWHPVPGWLLTAFDHGKQADRDFALADCQFAALTPATGSALAVKSLEWEDFDGHGAKATAMMIASYLIARWSDGKFEISVTAPGYSTGFGGERFHTTLEAAKAAAQADYEARILAALTPVAASEKPDACQQEDLVTAGSAEPVAWAHGCGYPCGYDCNGACFNHQPTPMTVEAAMDSVLNAASEYMKKVYGIAALSHPVDRERIFRALSGEKS